MPIDNPDFDENLYFEALDLQSMTNGESKPCNLIPPTPTSIRGAIGVAAQVKIDLETPMICFNNFSLYFQRIFQYVGLTRRWSTYVTCTFDQFIIERKIPTICIISFTSCAKGKAQTIISCSTTCLTFHSSCSFFKDKVRPANQHNHVLFKASG